MKVMKNISIVLILILLQVSIVSAQNFTRIFGQPHVIDGKGGRSVNFIDFNNDSYPDIFVSNGKGGGENNLLYLNNGDGTFTEQLSGDLVSDNASSDGASFVDFNNDGNLDGFVGNWYGQDNLLYLGNDTNNLEFQSSQIPSNDDGYSESCAFADYDNDGDLDFYVANSGGDLFNFFYINDGNGNFTKDTTSIITQDADVSRCGVWGDYDNDGDLDLFVANESNSVNRLFENLGDGTFSKITTGSIVTDVGDSWGASWGDYDNDLDMDLYVTNNSGQRNYLYQNNGDKTFTSITLVNPTADFVNSVSSSWIDYDNDADLDLFVTHGWGGAGQTNILYTNDGGGVFTKVAGEPIVTNQGWAYGHGWADYDKDGDLDLMVAKWLNNAENNLFYRNDTGSTNNWISVKCVGTESNSSAIGTKVYALATVDGSPVWQVREISSQHGYCTQNSFEVSFGLGDATTIDSLIIEWPNSEKSIQTSISINQFLTVYEDGVRIKADKNFGAVPLEVQFDNISGLAITGYDWNFGDGSNASDASPLYTYNTPGLYDIQLDVTTVGGNYGSIRNNYIAVHGDTIFPVSQIGMAGDTIIVPIEIHNYLPLSSITLPFQWSGDFNPTFVNLSNAGTDADFMTFSLSHSDLFNKRITFKLTSEIDSLLPVGSNIIAEAIFVIPGGASLGVVDISLDNYLTYSNESVSPYGSYTSFVENGSISNQCCVGIRGNIDSDPLEIVDISDLVWLVDFMFTAGPPPACLQEGNIDGDIADIIDISDLVALVDFMFTAGPPPASCS